MNGPTLNPERIDSLRPVLEELEGERLQARSRIRRTWWVAVLVAAGAAIAAFSFDVIPLCFLSVLALILAGFRTSSIHGNFTTRFKPAVLAPLVRAYDPSFAYNPNAGISRQEFEATRLFRNRIDRYSCEDLVEGRLGQTDLRFSEVHAQYKTETRDSKGNRKTRWHTLFKGLLFKADFNKHFSGTTFVLPDTAEKTFGAFGQTLQSWGSSHGELVRMEDPEFERAFVVYGSSQEEARYILSPALMARILDFHRRSGLSLHLGFLDASVVVGISMSRAFFEPSLDKSLLEPGALAEFWAELDLAAGLVDELNLNNRIWTKA